MDGDVMGTPVYTSPEQARGDIQDMGPHSDVYSAGAILCELMAGHRPYVLPGMRLSPYAIPYKVQEGPPDPLGVLDLSLGFLVVPHVAWLVRRRLEGIARRGQFFTSSETGVVLAGKRRPPTPK